MTIEWGPEIVVSGERPKWLADDVPVRGHLGLETRATHMVWRTFSSISLPADHFAYLAIAKGFEPWGGGDEAPADWDGGIILRRDGVRQNGAARWSWKGPHKPFADVIGYRKRAEPAAKSVPECRKLRPLFAVGTHVASLDRGAGVVIGANGGTNVAVQYGDGKIVEYVGVAQESLYEVPEGATIVEMLPAAEFDAMYRDYDLPTIFKHLNLIREETPIERFARETGTVVDDGNRAAIERALSWGKAS